MERGMIAFRDFVVAFRDLDLPPGVPIIAHASLSAFGHVRGGADTLLGAMLECYSTLIMPAFTYKTMITPEIGPPNNGLTYGEGRDYNHMAQFFRLDMPADRLMGILPETLRRHPQAHRSAHPILSFTGVSARDILNSQTIAEPLAPIELLRERGGWVLLLGVDQEVNTSIHNAERLAGRKQFVRWALTRYRVLECPAFPGCSDGFGALSPNLTQILRQTQVGTGMIQAIPLRELTEIVRSQVEADPLALLCDRSYCARCEAVRRHLHSPLNDAEHQVKGS
jgi:aminoglycoside 3-N-acetyltransferase